MTRSLVVVGVTESDEEVADYAIHYNLLHIVKIEPLGGNEKPTRRKTKRK